MNIKKVQNIYMVGIKGVGMTALSLILQKMGKNVWGSDEKNEYQTDPILHARKIQILEGFKEQNIKDNIDLLITTAAHGGLNNIEALEAKKRGIPVITHAEALGAIMNEFDKKIAVCGTHGKTTTTALIAYLFEKMKLKAGYHVGAPEFSGFAGGNCNGSDYFVTEADEYLSSPGIDNTPRFMYLDPDIVVCTSIEYDHPDVYETAEKMEDAYRLFFSRLDKKKGTLIYKKNDSRLCEIAATFPNLKTIAFSEEDFASVQLSVSGSHNRLNAVAALCVIRELGLDIDSAKQYISNFTAPKRRFEKIFERNGIMLYDDYAHHPTAIEATIQTCRQLYPDKKIVVIFQPHTYSRTQALQNDFIHALSKADTVLLTDIFSSARENLHDYQITSQILAENALKIGKTSIEYTPIHEVTTRLGELIDRELVIVTMGAGSIYMLHSDIITLINNTA